MKKKNLIQKLIQNLKATILAWRADPELITFPEHTVVIAKDQPQYRPIPAHHLPGDLYGRVTFCWKLSLLHRLRILFGGGLLWHQVLTFNEPLQPQMLFGKKPTLEIPPKKV